MQKYVIYLTSTLSLLGYLNAAAETGCNKYAPSDNMHSTENNHIWENDEQLLVINRDISNTEVNTWISSGKKDLVLCGFFTEPIKISGQSLRRIEISPTQTKGDIQINDVTLSSGVRISGIWNHELIMYKIKAEEIDIENAKFSKDVSLIENDASTLKIFNNNFKGNYLDLASTYHNLEIKRDAPDNAPIAFEKNLALNKLTITGDMTISSAQQFEPLVIAEELELTTSTIKGMSTFKNTDIHEKSNFRSSRFEGGLSFRESKFSEWVNVIRTYIGSPLKMEGAVLGKGIDFRMASLAPNIDLYLEALRSDRDVIFGEEQISNARIALSPAENREIGGPREERMRIEYIYEILADTFKRRGYSAQADQLQYAYSNEALRLEPTLARHLYGALFGYGYQPWRFVLFVMLPLVLIFAATWLFFFYRPMLHALARLDGDETKPNIISLKALWLIPLKIPVEQNTDEHSTHASRLTSFIIALHFSFSAFFSIRFKRKWLDPINGSFNHIVVVEYITGLTAIAIFALGAKVSSFDVIKNFLGI